MWGKLSLGSAFFVIILTGPVKIVLVGDFTMVTEGGWGFGVLQDHDTECEVHRRGLEGRSSGILSVGTDGMVVKVALPVPLRIRIR